MYKRKWSVLKTKFVKISLGIELKLSVAELNEFDISKDN